MGHGFGTFAGLRCLVAQAQADIQPQWQNSKRLPWHFKSLIFDAQQLLLQCRLVYTLYYFF